MKKLLAIAMCLALMVTSMVTVSADVDATITIATVDGPFAAGDEVAIPVTITEWANAYATIEFTLEYDDTLLELDAIEPSETDFGGAMSASNGNKFGLVCNPSSDRQAKKLLGGEVCVIYFYAATDINESTVVNFSVVTVNGYANGESDNWTATQALEFDVVEGGVKGGDEHECAPSGDIQYDETDHWYNCETVGCGNLVNKAPHEGGEATCSAKAVCTVCGAEYGNLNAENHAGETEVRDDVDADCGNDGYTGDTYCLDCDTMIAEGEAILATGEHTGGTATCNAKAVCGVCGAEYGNVDAENHVGETEVRNSSDSYTGDTYCLDCGAMIEEGEAIDPTTGSAVVTNATVESGSEVTVTVSLGANTKLAAYGATLVYDDTKLELIEMTPGTFCAAVNKDTAMATGFSVTDVTSGTLFTATFKALAPYGEAEVTVEFDDDSTCNARQTPIEMTTTAGIVTITCKHEGGTATCKDQAVCEICQEPYGNLDAENHVGETEVRDDVPASCYEEGYTGDTYCLDCDAMIEEGEVIPATGEHSGGIATCNAKAECGVCGAEYGELDADNHIGETEVRNDKEADCMEEGYTGDTYCLDCEALLEEGEVIPVDNGNHKGPANDEYGYDEENHWFTCECGEEVEKEAHKGGEATCVAKAVCDVCGQEYGELDAEGHFGGTATCAAKAKCDGCGAEYGELDADNHANTEERDGDTYCKDCGELVEEGEPAPETPTEPTTPPTGDASNVAVAGALCLAAAAAAFVLTKKRG